MTTTLTVPGTCVELCGLCTFGVQVITAAAPNCPGVLDVAVRLGHVAVVIEFVGGVTETSVAEAVPFPAAMDRHAKIVSKNALVFTTNPPLVIPILGGESSVACGVPPATVSLASCPESSRVQQ
ncbi:hypothetical protein IOD16_09755 [Saccharothrix sp. 6-C]|uniref:hypothetical protein n=1 Tax=Saccharothrix sp. 6-C TaxID=2781735 RepID=UPI0019175AE9|nr:hypothetical protein [Saccharothrix sp. 6-C]QQQ78700.1 hypothetical protein IOD16_09755 [Saccharothrix sp. 6-C]